MLRQSMARLALFLALVFAFGQGGRVAVHAQTAVYYVDQGHAAASDENDGSEDRPWLTVQKAADTAQAGDVVYIKDGVYNEIVTAHHSGSDGAMITFAAYPGHTPVLDGSGEGGWYGVFTIQGEDYIRLEGLDIRNNDTGWGVLVEHEEDNVSNAATDIELVNLEVHHTGGEAIQVRGNAQYVTISECVVHDADDPSGIDVYQWDEGRPHHVTITDNVAYNYPGFAGIASEQADDLVVADNTIYDSGLGIDVGSGDRNLISGNVVHDCDTGIALSSNEDSTVAGNLVYNIADEALYSYYWIEHGEDHARNAWYNNTVYNAGFGIYESDRKDSRYGTGPTADHEYYNNVFYAVGAHGSYRTPFYFRGTTGLKFYDNTLVLNPGYDALELLLGATGADIRNNIFSLSGNVSPVIVDEASEAGAVIDYNGYYNADGAVSGPGEHSVTGDPLFTPDYHVQAGSPCIDSGADLSAHHTGDKDGVSRPQGAGWDIGAYEFVALLDLAGRGINRAIELAWTVSTTLPETSTWMINYEGLGGTAYLPIVGLDSATRAYTLAGLTNNVWYTVTLDAMLDGESFLHDSVRVMPFDASTMTHAVYLPLVLR